MSNRVLGSVVPVVRQRQTLFVAGDSAPRVDHSDGN